MKSIITLFLLTVSGLLQAQQKDTVSFFIDGLDHKVEPKMATYLRIGIRQDTMWRVYDLYLHGDKLRMQGWSKDDSLQVKHGPHEYFSKQGKLIERGIYVNGRKQGPWKQFSENGRTIDSTLFINGIPAGTYYRYNENGTLVSKGEFDNEGKGNGTVIHYYANGTVRDSGNYSQNQRTGVWYFYREDKSIASDVTFEKDSVVSSHNFDVKGTLISSKLIEEEASYPGGEEAWNKYLGNIIGKIYDRKDYLTYQGSCLIEFKVEKDGSIQYCDIVESSNDQLAEYAISMIKKTKKWNPAIQYNLPVNAWRRQRFSFYITE